MDFEEAIKEIESLEFLAFVNVTSSIRSFIKAINSQDAVICLSKKISEGNDCDKLIKRIIELSAQSIDDRYENPHDTSFCVYMLLLNTANPKVGKMAAAYVLQAHNCFWAKKIARSIQRQDEYELDSTLCKLDMQVADSVKYETISNADDRMYNNPLPKTMDHLISNNIFNVSKSGDGCQGDLNWDTNSRFSMTHWAYA